MKARTGTAETALARASLADRSFLAVGQAVEREMNFSEAATDLQAATALLHLDRPTVFAPFRTGGRSQISLLSLDGFGCRVKAVDLRRSDRARCDPSPGGTLRRLSSDPAPWREACKCGFGIHGIEAMQVCPRLRPGLSLAGTKFEDLLAGPVPRLFLAFAPCPVPFFPTLRRSGERHSSYCANLEPRNCPLPKSICSE